MKTFLKCFVLFSVGMLLLTAACPDSSCQEFSHIDQMFQLRTSISAQGKALPDLIKASSGSDLRNLERIFELNTSALTTIEAYFRVFKIAFTVNQRLTKDSVVVLNEWLAFIKNQCKYDIDYLDEALAVTKNKDIANQIETSKKNILQLEKIAGIGIRENEESLAQ